MSKKLIYTTPESVINIMQKFGSKGFNNTPNGLFYTNDGQMLVFKKGEEVTYEKLGRSASFETLKNLQGLSEMPKLPNVIPHKLPFKI